MLHGLIFSTFEVCSNTEGSFTCEEAEEEVKVKSLVTLVFTFVLLFMIVMKEGLH